jgi:hypothetical protein
MLAQLNRLRDIVGVGFMNSNAGYFRRRANEERVAAMKAPHPAARAAHVEMAKRYDELAGTVTAVPQMIVEKAS